MKFKTKNAYQFNSKKNNFFVYKLIILTLNLKLKSEMDDFYLFNIKISIT